MRVIFYRKVYLQCKYKSNEIMGKIRPKICRDRVANGHPRKEDPTEPLALVERWVAEACRSRRVGGRGRPFGAEWRTFGDSTTNRAWRKGRRRGRARGRRGRRGSSSWWQASRRGVPRCHGRNGLDRVRRHRGAFAIR